MDESTTTDLPPRPTREQVGAALTFVERFIRQPGPGRVARNLAAEVLHLRAEREALEQSWDASEGEGIRLRAELEQATARAAAMHAVVEAAREWATKRVEDGLTTGRSVIPSAQRLLDALAALDGA
jgi:hypothetical protein